MRDDVKVVVVTWNAAEHVERSLASVEGYATVVVDNGSTDGTVALVRERFPGVTVIVLLLWSMPFSDYLMRLFMR